MKAYNKPEFYVTEFVPNQAVSVCPEDTITADTKVTVNCVITQSHSIFYDNCGEDNYNNMTVVNNFYTTSGSQTSKNNYLVWGKVDGKDLTAGEFDASATTYDGSSADKAVQNKGQSILDALVDIILGREKKNDWMGVHGGVITPEVYKVRNSSI